jgi:hypothetical protein
MANERTQTQRLWEADLTEPGRRLTLDELAALETMHQCQALQRMQETLVFMLMHLRSVEARIDRLEQYLQRVDARYPRGDRPESGLILAGGRAAP